MKTQNNYAVQLLKVFSFLPDTVRIIVLLGTSEKRQASERREKRASVR
jgi:hypothetical protein